MLWQIIKAYWQSRKQDCVLIISPRHGDIFTFNTEIIHVQVKIKTIPSGRILKQYDYVGNTVVRIGTERS